MLTHISRQMTARITFSITATVLFLIIILTVPGWSQDSRRGTPPHDKRTAPQAPAARSVTTFEDEIHGNLKALRGGVSLHLNHKVRKLEVFSGRKKLATLGKGKTFDVTAYISQATDNGLTFYYYGPGNLKNTQVVSPGGIKEFLPKQPTREATAKLLPDLIVEDMGLNDECQFQITLKNNGTGGVQTSGYDPKKGIKIQVYNGGSPWGETPLATFDRTGKLKRPGGQVEMPWFPDSPIYHLGPGSHQIKVTVVDQNNLVPEINERNNTNTKLLICRKTARSAKATAISRKPVTAAKITSTAEVAGRSFHGKKGPVIPSQRSLHGLNEQEKLELGNTTGELVPLGGGGTVPCDISIESMRILPKHPGVGERFTFEIEILNRSDDTVPWTGQIGIDVIGPGKVLFDRAHYAIFDLPKQERRIISHNFRAPTYGIYRNNVKIGCPVIYFQSAQNDGSIVYGVNPRPDLAVYIPYTQAVKTGHHRTVHAHVKNIGEFRSPPSTLTFKCTDKGDQEHDVPALDPQESWSTERRDKYKLLDHKHIKCTATVDPGNEIGESNDDNNVGSTEFYRIGPFQGYGTAYNTTEAQIDLEVEKISPNSTIINKKIPIYISVINHDDNEVSPPSVIRIKIEEIGTRTADVPGLFPGERFSLLYHAEWSTAGQKDIEIETFFTDNSVEDPFPANNILRFAPNVVVP